MITILLLATTLACNATIFGYPGDKWAGGDALALKRPVNPTDMGIAHRTWPLGTTVMVYNPRTKLFAVGTVIDRGPYGAMHKGKWVLKRKRRDPGKWRGCVDLTPALAKAVQHNGYEKVRVWRLDLPEGKK